MSVKEIWRELNTDNIESADVIIMGVPFDENVSCGKGAAQAPAKMRELSAYLPPVTEDGKIIKGLTVCDFGDVEKSLHENVPEYFNRVCAKARKVFDLNKFPVFLGGDHSVSIPLRRAFARHYSDKKIGIIHFDAHADICDVYDDNKFSHANVNRRSIDDGFAPENILAFGIRSFEIQELEFYAQHPESHLITAPQLAEKSAAHAVAMICKIFDASFDAIYLSIDIDCLDPSAAPGTGTPEAGGLTSRFVLDVVKAICARLPIRALDLVEVSPPHDVNDITSWAALKIMLEAIYYVNQKKESHR
ncbi:MAG: agmatinase [Firmicutes bacterium]|nr:agmatinase [Bacillota bacterium]